MASDNARLTEAQKNHHANYDLDTFRSDNSGGWSLPNAADRRFIEHINSLNGYKAQFYSVKGDVMVSSTNGAIDGNVPSAIEMIAEHYDMELTNDYESDHVVTFQYIP